MLEIVMLQEFPEAAKFCSDYIESLWEYSHQESTAAVNECLHEGNDIPFILVAKEGNNLMGVIMTSSKADDVSKKYSPWLQMLYVKEEFRNKGIGKRLVEAACKRMKNLGYPRVYIDTANASGFYEKLGWKFVEDAKWKSEIVRIFVTAL